MRTMRTTLFVAIIGAISLWSDAGLAQSAVSFGPQLGISKSSDTDAKMLVGTALRLKLLPAEARVLFNL